MGFQVYRFKHLDTIEYLGIKINEKGNIIELRLYFIDEIENLYQKIRYLGIKEV